MKKILLIIAITFCIFQMVVLATDIIIGSPATDRPSSLSDNITSVCMENPANASGKIISVEIYAYDAEAWPMTGIEVATFFVVSGNNLSTRDSQALANITTSGKHIREVDLNVVEGDYLGIFYSGGYIERDTTGFDGIWFISGDNIPCSDVTFGVFGGDTISLYGTGETTPTGITWNGIVITKWNGITITKINGK